MDAISKPLIRNPLFFQSFLRNNIFKINDIWDKNNNTFVDNQTIFNRLDDKRNWISEWAKIKKSIQENFKPLISEHLQRKNQLKCFYRISVTSDYLSHSMSPSH
jgi:hypothetical protein